MKKCPYCAEEIQDEAIVCRYCGRDLRQPVAPVQQIQPPKQTQDLKPFAPTKRRLINIVTFVIVLCMACLFISNFVADPKPKPNAVKSTETAGLKSSVVVSTFTAVSTSTTAPTRTLAPTYTSVPTIEDLAIDTSTPWPVSATSFQNAEGASCIPENIAQTGKVVDVVDGDTIKVLLDQDGKTYTIRYIGMDTPEYTTSMEYYGSEAAIRNVELVMGKTVTLIKDVSETDRYGRLLRYVIADNVFVNYDLVAQGFANTTSFPPDISCIPTFQAAERKAASAKLGLWYSLPTQTAHPTLATFPTSGSGSGGNAPCNCGGPDLDCGNFSSHASAQACYNYCVSQGFGDVFRLDGNDNDGRACESLP